MSTRNPKVALFAHFAAVAKSLGHPHRLELLEQLAQGERSVEVLADRTRLSVANASQHLQHMRRAGLLANRREGKFVYYQLVDDTILDLLAALRRIAERNVAEVERVIRNYFHNRDSLEPVSRKELLRRSRAGEVIILDVRPEDEFALGHLPGAVSIPLRNLEKRLPSSILRKRSLPTAVVPIASSLMRRSLFCGRGGSKLDDLRMASRNGAPLAWRSLPALRKLGTKRSFNVSYWHIASIRGNAALRSLSERSAH